MTLLPLFFKHPHKNDPPSVTGKSAIFMGKSHECPISSTNRPRLGYICSSLPMAWSFTRHRGSDSFSWSCWKGWLCWWKSFKIWAIYPQSPWFSGKLWQIFGIWVCSNHIVLWPSQMHETITGHHSIVFAIKRTQMVFCTNNSRNLSSKRGWFNQSQD